MRIAETILSLMRREVESRRIMIIEPLKALLFGEVRKVDIHCGCPDVATRLRQRVSETIALDLQGSDVVAVSIKPSCEVDYALVHYTAGLLSPAHADVMVLPQM